MNLANKKCIPCENGTTKPLTIEQAQVMLANIKGWTLNQEPKNTPSTILQLIKNLHFKDFRSALLFANELGDLAEFEGHHPDIYLHHWNQLQITFNTQSIKGLSENDFIMAAKVNQLLADAEN